MAFLNNDNVFLFIPNLIGYFRIVLAVIAFWNMSSNYVVSVWCYLISALLDAVDGHAARTFNQSTRFGAMLDQLTDRCGTMGLMVALSYFYPRFMFWFQLSMAIDVSCHWLYMQTSVIIGKTSHKAFNVNDNAIMRIYYQKSVLTFMCCANELFYITLYILHFTTGPSFLGLSLFKMISIISLPFAILKAMISCLHAYVASKDLAALDVKERQIQRKQKETFKKCNGPSMEPTLRSKNVLLTERVSARLFSPNRGDIIIAKSPINPTQYICKRVVALPGDKIITKPVSNMNKPIINIVEEENVQYIPRGHVWIEGDNSENSSDSRYYGPIPQGLIKSRAVCRLWPLSEVKLFI